MNNNMTEFKLLKATKGKPDRRLLINGNVFHVIVEDEFTSEEIEELRDLEKWEQENGNPPYIANFLPDDIRPSHVKKL